MSSKHIVTADDVKRIAETGERELMLREHTVLTDAALDAASQLGIRLVEGSTYSTASSAAVPTRPGAGGLPTPALGGLTREAPRHLTVDEPPPAPPPRRDAAGLPSPAISGLIRVQETSGQPPRSEIRIEGLPDRTSLHTQLFIDGDFHDAFGGETVPTIDPATNQPIADVAAAQAPDVDRAVAAARRAFPAWRDLDPEKRSRILLRVAESSRRSRSGSRGSKAGTSGSRSARQPSSTCPHAGILGVSIRGSYERSTAVFSRCPRRRSTTSARSPWVWSG